MRKSKRTYSRVPAQISVFEPLLEKWAPKIYVDARRDVFTFQCGSKFLQLSTCLHVSAAGPEPRVLAVGDHAALPNATRIDLFADDSHMPPNVEPLDVLCSFLAFALKNLMSKSAMIRPVFVFRNAQEFEGYFHGYQKTIFSLAGVSAGAMTVRFE